MGEQTAMFGEVIPLRPGSVKSDDPIQRRQRVDEGELFEIYKRVDSILTKRPLSSFAGSEREDYAGLIRDVALRLWHELDTVYGKELSASRLARTRAAFLGLKVSEREQAIAMLQSITEGRTKP